MGKVSLLGARALVTGGSSGIGRSLCLELARRGLDVISVSNVPADLDSLVREIRAGGGRADSLEIDLGDPLQVCDLLSRAESAFGPVDVLINNAGIGYHAALLQIEEAELRRLFEINFFALVSLSRQALASMARRKRGHILNLSSASARLGLARMCAYAASKGAVHTFTQSLRLEAAPLGVRVHEVLPISVRTPFFAQARNLQQTEYRPHGKVQTPEQIASLAWTCLERGVPELCSDRATGWAFALEALAPNLVARALTLFERLQPGRRP